MYNMAQVNAPAPLQFRNSAIFGTIPKPLFCLQVQSRSLTKKPFVIEARANARKESAKIRNRKMQKKFNGTATHPRLSVFCSDKQLYAILVDDKNKKCLFYGSTLQKSFRQNPTCSAVVEFMWIALDQEGLVIDLMGLIPKLEAAQRVGEALVKACVNLNINEISSYDRNGFGHGQRLDAFEIAISSYGFLPR